MTAQLMAPPRTSEDFAAKRLDAHVVFLTNFIPPHQIPLLQELACRVRKLTVLLSTPMEANRSWMADWGDLDVQVQRTITWHRSWRHAVGFSEDNYVHLPWDTVFRLKSLAPDVIISGQLGMRSLLSICYRRFAKNSRLVLLLGLSEHTERGRGRIALRKWLLRRCECVVINGRSGQRYIESLGVEPSRIYRYPYAASPIFYEQGSAFRAPEIAHRLLYAGRFADIKGVLPFLNALRSWAEAHRDRAVDLDLIGGGPLERAIADFRMPNNVRLELHGMMDYEQLPAAFQKRGIMVLPTLADEWALIVNEALAAGLPVLGSLYSQAVEDLCIEGINGWTYRPDVGNEMEQALDRALSTTCEELNRMRHAARESVANVTVEGGVQVLYDAVERSLR